MEQFPSRRGEVGEMESLQGTGKSWGAERGGG